MHNARPAGDISGVRAAHRPGDERYLDPAMAADALTSPPCPLMPRELEVLRLAEFDTPAAVLSLRTIRPVAHATSTWLARALVPSMDRR